MDASLVSAAIVVWTGWSKTPWPARDEGRLVERYGYDLAAALLPQIRELVDDFYASDVRFTVADVKQMGDVAGCQFHKAHPAISDDAVRALTWCYTYDYK